MMRNLGSVLAILMMIMLFAFQCEKPLDCCVPPVCSDEMSLSGTWRLIAFRDVSSGKQDEDPNPDGKGVVFTFSDDGKDGSIQGHTFVNTVFGKYTLGDGCTYTIDGFGGSKVGEPGWSGKAWLSSESGNYERIGNNLILYRNKGAEGIVFRKIE